MTARPFGDIIPLAQAAATRRTFQPVRRNSYNLGERELHLWRPIDPREINARMQAAQRYDREHKCPGQRNGSLGHVGIEILEALYRTVDYATGRLDPSIDWICRAIRRSRAAVVRGMARLKLHGFLGWIRRTEPTGIEDGAGPRIRQITNAYVFGLPRDVAGWVAKKLGRAPRDAMEAKDRLREAWGAFHRNRPTSPLSDEVRDALRKRAARRSSASSPGAQNPAEGAKE